MKVWDYDFKGSSSAWSTSETINENWTFSSTNCNGPCLLYLNRKQMPIAEVQFVCYVNKLTGHKISKITVNEKPEHDNIQAGGRLYSIQWFRCVNTLMKRIKQFQLIFWSFHCTYQKQTRNAYGSIRKIGNNYTSETFGKSPCESESECDIIAQSEQQKILYD